MKLTEIANRLREVAASIESVAMKSDEDDFEFPNISFSTPTSVDWRCREFGKANWQCLHRRIVGIAAMN
jgi:hypothetical protein